MTVDLSDRSRRIIESLPMIEAHRDLLEEALGRQMALRGPRLRPGVEPGLVARELSAMVVGQARALTGPATAESPMETALRHRRLGIGGEHYAIFGDTLKPILQDVLGRHATPALRAAWGDFFWATVRAQHNEQRRLAA